MICNEIGLNCFLRSPLLFEVLRLLFALCRITAPAHEHVTYLLCEHDHFVPLLSHLVQLCVEVFELFPLFFWKVIFGYSGGSHQLIEFSSHANPLRSEDLTLIDGRIQLSEEFGCRFQRLLLASLGDAYRQNQSMGVCRLLR